MATSFSFSSTLGAKEHLPHTALGKLELNMSRWSGLWFAAGYSILLLFADSAPNVEVVPGQAEGQRETRERV